MLCQICKKNNATIHYKSNVNGKIYETYMCESCAQNKGFSPDTSSDSFWKQGFNDTLFSENANGLFGGLFAGMLNENGANSYSKPQVCKKCGMRFSDFLHGGKIGCAECYNTFSSLLNSTIKRIHGNVEHCGKSIEGDTNESATRKKIETLREKLNEAIEKQEYEMAAKYRDEIKELEKQSGTEEK